MAVSRQDIALVISAVVAVSAGLWALRSAESTAAARIASLEKIVSASDVKYEAAISSIADSHKHLDQRIQEEKDRTNLIETRQFENIKAIARLEAALNKCKAAK